MQKVCERHRRFPQPHRRARDQHRIHDQNFVLARGPDDLPPRIGGDLSRPDRARQNEIGVPARDILEEICLDGPVMSAA